MDQTKTPGAMDRVSILKDANVSYSANATVPAQPPAVGGEPEVIAIIESALRRSFSLGQIYWQQADSDSTCQQNKSDQTMEVQAQHILMVVESLRKLFKAQPVTAKVVLPEEDSRRTTSTADVAFQNGWNACLDEVAKLNEVDYDQRQARRVVEDEAV